MIEAFFLWGGIQSLIVSILIPIIKNNKNNLFLTSIFGVTALNIFFQYSLRFTTLKYDSPQLLITPDILDLLLATLLYQYVHRIVLPNGLNVKNKFFFVPIVWFSVLVFYVLTIDNFTFYSYIDTNIHLVSLILVFCWKVFLLMKMVTSLKQNEKLFTRNIKVMQLWLRTLSIFMVLITVVGFVNVILFLSRAYFFDLNAKMTSIMWQASNVNYIILTCYIIFMSVYMFIKYPKILFKTSTKIKDTKYANQFREIAVKLKALEEEKPFLDYDLTERTLAEKLNVKPYLLSKFLNKALDKSFSEFINEKRINEAKLLLETKTNLNLIMFEIALDSGFKSESSFYSNFKKYTGMTPKEYQKSILESKDGLVT